MRDDALITCPFCAKDELKRVLCPVHVYSRGEPTTLAQQGDRNMEKMGIYEKQTKQHEIDEAKKRGRKELPKAPKPFWRKTDKIDTNLAKLAPNVKIEKGKIVDSEPMSQKAMDYIMTGKKPL